MYCDIVRNSNNYGYGLYGDKFKCVISKDSSDIACRNNCVSASFQLFDWQNVPGGAIGISVSFKFMYCYDCGMFCGF